MPNLLRPLAVIVLLVFLSACGDPSKQDIIRKAKDADTRDLLENALGMPDSVSKLGPVEKWTYTASDGKVVFILAGNTVAIQATGESDLKN
jgi:hypothetical protein